MRISFKKKIPVFLESMLNSFYSHFKKLHEKSTTSYATQTENVVSS